MLKYLKLNQGTNMSNNWCQKLMIEGNLLAIHITFSSNVCQHGFGSTITNSVVITPFFKDSGCCSTICHFFGTTHTWAEILKPQTYEKIVQDEMVPDWPLDSCQSIHPKLLALPSGRCWKPACTWHTVGTGPIIANGRMASSEAHETVWT